jgi:transposase
MMGKKLIEEARDRSVSAKPLKEYIPKNHLLVKIDNTIDFSFIYDEVNGLYAEYGTDSIDPVVVFKMLLIGFLYNIKSERNLIDEIKYNILYRYFIGYALDEPIPDRAILCRIRKRWGEDTFRRIFNKILQMCIDANLVGGKSASIDSTLVKAKGTKEVDRLYWEKNVKEYIDKINETDEGMTVEELQNIKKKL